MQRARSQLHLQLGQEVIYVLMTLGLMMTLVMIASTFGSHEPMPLLPECALPGKGPCVSQKDIPPLPDCALPGKGPCVSQKDIPPLPDCALPGKGPCVSQKDIPPLPDCAMPGKGPCVSQKDIPKQPPQQPPILNLTEREGFRFPTGSYVIGEQFKEKLRTVIVPEILRLGAEYHASVVEVVGHTDSVPMREFTSSLDRKLNGYLSGEESVADMADNVGLGMMRAASVVRALRNVPDLQRGGFVFLAMSAGQTIAPDDRLIGQEPPLVAGDETRRRVQIRLRRSLREP